MLISEDGARPLPRRGADHGRGRAQPGGRRLAGPPGAARAHRPCRSRCSYAGKPSAEKRADIAAVLREAKLDAAIITDPASIAWLLNIRGGDVDFTPFALGFLLLQADETATLFMDPAKLPEATRQWLGNGVVVARAGELEPSLAGLARQARARRWRRARRPGSRSGCARPAPRWSMRPTHACCPRRARTRPSRTARARRTGGMRSPSAGSCTGSKRQAGQTTEMRRRRAAAGVPARGRRIPRRELSGDFGRRGAWRRDPLPGHARPPTGRSSRTRPT